MSTRPSIAIIGGGCSGALAALHLLRSQRPARVHLIEPRSNTGAGLAYSTPCLQHLLNVPARSMSILPSAPQDFLEWLRNDTGAAVDPDTFVARAQFGRYVRERLEAARRDARPNIVFERHPAEVLDIRREGDRSLLHMDDGTRLEADTAVLALGNAAPRRLPFFPAAGTKPMFYESAWDPGALAPADSDSPIVLIGSGLTAVDAVVGLRANGHRGLLHMISRRGLLPQRHCSFKKTVASWDPRWSPMSLRELVRQVRIRIAAAEHEGSNWREVMDSLRRTTNELWRGLTPQERARFCRHAKAYWDTHRHRMAPEVAVAIDEARHTGSLRVHAGRIQRVTEGADKLNIDLRLRSQESVRLCAARVINCTGSEQDYRRVDSPLLRSLFGKGWLDANALGVGIRTVENGAVVGQYGNTIPGLYAIGPMKIGGLLETTAVPEIREQAAALARTLLGERLAVRTMLRRTDHSFTVGAR